MQFGILRINCGSVFIFFERVPVITGRFKLDALLIMAVPFAFLVIIQTGGMQRTKWITVLQITSDCAQNNRHAGILSRAQNIVQILFEMRIVAQAVWIIVSKLMLFEHIKAAPCFWGGRMPPS